MKHGVAAPDRAEHALCQSAAPLERTRDLLEEIELADQVGLDVFGLGEHHRAGHVHIIEDGTQIPLL